MTRDEPKQDNSVLADRIVKQLNEGSTGVQIARKDFAAVHRNGPINGPSAATKPPSVTVSFYNSNVHDDLLQAYPNFDKRANKPKQVRIYQSLSKNFTTLKYNISEYCKNDLKRPVKYIRWRSQSSGLVVKFADKDTNVLKKIFCFEDFLKQV